jgi:ketosteroid isomerase-like protein
MLLLLPALYAPAPPISDEATALVELVRRHTEAQRMHDQETLKRTTADTFVEVSPAGEVDPREKWLGFYAPDKNSAMPTLTVLEPQARVFGDTGIVIAKLAIVMKAPDGSAREMAMRVTWVARRVDGVWSLISSQYTGIRPPQPVAAKAN